MEFFRRARGSPARLGVFPGAFNPPTRAHLALARAALSRVDEVLFVVPRVFPHKHYEGASFEDRIAMLEAALFDEPRFSVGSTPAGLFIDIARECRAVYGAGVELFFLCGRDAAERIVGWDYGRPDAFAGMLAEFKLLVASRGGAYQPPAGFEKRIHPLELHRDLSGISATELRRRIALKEPWEHLAPEEVVDMVRKIYGKSG
jgi:nicotinate-nucleotide adenylyltransferase